MMFYGVGVEGEENLEHGMTSIVCQFIPNSGPVYHLQSFPHIPGVRARTRRTGKGEKRPVSALEGRGQRGVPVLAVGGLAAGSPATAYKL